ncbi:uncharacterized protein [Triticum aestivum]|uniref:uncharacterized protein n=1 Tax=Triticum aestivum TaxID=4565 RepID=UPI0008446BDE|nr:uncharacterized protein LOC123083430 [Triticum aestivum]
MSDGFRCWADLPDGLLDSIIARLGASRDLFAFEATCRSWRAAFSSCPAGFPPLLLQPDVSLCSSRSPTFRKSLVPTRPCQVTDIANRDTTRQCFEIPIFWIPRGKKALPSPLENFCFIGASYGHVIFFNNKSCVLFDVFTGVTTSSPQLPVLGVGGPIYGALTAPLGSANSYLIIEAGSQNLFWRVGSQSWVAHSLRHGALKQIVVFQGQVFGMDSDRRLFKVHLTPKISIQELPVTESIMIAKWHLSDALLVACGDMLLLVAMQGNTLLTFEVFQLDLSTEPALWLKVERLLHWAIFISHDKRSQALSCMNPNKWGGRSNCIYFYDRWSKRWIAFELGMPGHIYGYVTGDCDRRVQPMWFFPSMLSLHR